MSLGIERIFSYAAWADKFDGAVHNPPFRNVAIAMNEPIGTVAVDLPRQTRLCSDSLSLVLPLLAMGNTVLRFRQNNIHSSRAISISSSIPAICPAEPSIS